MGNVALTTRIDAHLKVAQDQPQLHVETLREEKKRILFVSSEFADLVKVGGLGDVSAALPRAISDRHDIRVLVPGYRQVMESGQNIRIVGEVPGQAALPPCKIGRMDLADGLIVYVLINPELYERDGNPYGDANGRDWPDNHIRFARLGLAAAEIASGTACIRWCPELVHANDWPSALAPAYMTWRRVKTPTVLTIHNLAYQGLCDMHSCSELGIPAQACTSEGMEFYGKLSFLKAGIAYASHVTTVSRNYSQEIKGSEFGCGLDGLLQSKANKGQFSGIVNGIDESWESRTDSHLVENFAVHEWDKKALNKAYVERLFNLEPGNGPLFGVVSRLVQQKGIDLTCEIAEEIVSLGGRLVVIGRGEPELEQVIADLGRRHPGRIGVNVGFNETDARRIFAGSDFLLMPSRFEPCGLSQMYAQRFASLPIARRTGGLADTIEDGVTGFLFDKATVDSYREAVHRAFNVYQHPELLNAMRCKAMSAPLCWRESVTPYDELYQALIGGRAQAAEAH